MAVWSSGTSLEYVRSNVERCEQLPQGETTNAGGTKFQRQWEAVEASAQIGDHLSILSRRAERWARRSRAVDEQLDCG